MNKDELLKIYSAYLPYGLLIETRTDEEIKTEGSYISKLTGVDHLGLHDEFANCWEFEVRPILYDLSYLTKEIEHEGERFVPLHRILEEYCFDLSKMDEEYILSFKESLIEVDMSYKTAQMLLSWHFNVFNLPEDQFINKATLTNK